MSLGETALGELALGELSAEAVFPINWAYSQKITIDNTKVGATLTGFRMLVTEDHLHADVFVNAQANGGDLRFSSDAEGVTQLPCEIISFDSTETQIWVKVPSVSGSVDTDVYIWYGTEESNTQHAIGAIYGRNAVWSTSFGLVAHQEEDPSGGAPQMVDSTGNGNNGTSAGGMTSGDSVSAQIGNGVDFDGGDDLINHGSDATLDNIFDGGGSVSALVKAVSDGEGNNGRIIDKGSAAGWILYVGNESGSNYKILFLHDFTGGVAYWRTDSVDGDIGAFNHIAVDYDNSDTANDPIIYVDGVAVAITELAAPSGTRESDAAFDLLVGNNAATDRSFDGDIDEPRVATVTRGADWYLTEYNNQFNPATFASSNTPVATSVFPIDWGYKQKITIDNTKVDATLTSFPVLITEDHLHADVFTNAQANGGDLRFSSDADGVTQLACEVVSFGASETQIWVTVPSVSSSVDTDIYIWYDTEGGDAQPTVTDTYGRNNVWDSDYLAVYHLEEDPSGGAPQMVDSSGSDFHGTSGGTMTSGDSVAVKIGDGLDFEGTDDYINCGDNCDIGTNDMTLQAWVYREGADDYQGVISKSTWDAETGRWMLLIDDNNKLSALLGGASEVYGWAISTASIAASTNTAIAATFNRDGNITNYINGSVDGTDDISAFSSEDLNTTRPMKLGSLGAAGSDDPFKFLDGRIDEARVSKIVRAATWLSTEYNNQNSPATFASSNTPVEIVAAIVITGTAIASITEADMVTGGKTIILTVSNDTWVT